MPPVLARNLEEKVDEVVRGRADPAKRDQILEGARKVFLLAGFDGASMGEIARASGVSKGTLYVYFDSKEALFEALTHAERGGLAEVLFRLDEADPDVPAVLRRIGLQFVDLMIRPDHISSVRMVIGASEKFPRLGQSFYDSGPRFGTERLSAYLARQVVAGRLAIDDCWLAAEQFFNLCSAGVLKRKLFGVEGRDDQQELARTVESAVAVFLAAYGRASSLNAAATRA